MKFWLLPLWTILVIALYFLFENTAPFDFGATHYFALWLGVAIVILSNVYAMKQVSIHGEQIHVSDFKETKIIPLSDVEYVSGSRFAMPELVWFRTKNKKIIVFMAKQRFSIFQFHRHPVVEELAELCGLDDY